MLMYSLVVLSEGIHSSSLEVQAPLVAGLIHQRLERALYDIRFPPPENPIAWWSQPRPEGLSKLGGVESQFGYSPSDEEDIGQN